VRNEAQAEASGRSAAKAWLRALELTAPIPANPGRILPNVIEDLAARHGDAPALLSEGTSLSYRALAERANQYARWALDQGVAKGDTVCLLMPNRPEYMAIWLGITRAGGVVALLNTNLVGPSLAHCIKVVAPKHVIADAELSECLTSALADSPDAPKIWIIGGDQDRFSRIDRDIERRAGSNLSESETPSMSIEDRALYIYTSGTTGMPKAANVSHFRLMQWSHWFAGLMGTGAEDRMYNCLPMYHSVGGVLATGAILVGGGSVVIKEKFAARQFWSDIVRWECTLFQYIGELCRYLLNTEPGPDEAAHRIRMCSGNGLRPDVWEKFRKRFRIPRILEFYAATEGNFSLFNVEGKAGAIGRIPPFLAHRFPAALVQVDLEKAEPVRDTRGLCTRCANNEVGEAIGKIPTGRSSSGARFDGYSSREDSEKKVLRDVFEWGDAWYRTGDLMRIDDQGHFYFVDRIGDTFRWKGENVSTSEVEAAICAFPGVKDACVYGVTVPEADGRAGMAAMVTGGEIDLSAFWEHLMARLPAYALPLFLRLRSWLEVTATFKHAKSDLARQGYDPAASGDAYYFRDAARGKFVPLDRALHDRIRNGALRL
jgi:fatty-acyl-CoA synthase